MQILIRTDASSQIGAGHVMRDLVLARQFDDDTVIFATRDLPGDQNHKITEQGYERIALASNGLDELLAIIERRVIDMVIIDHYEIDAAYEKALKTATGITLFVLDDTYEKHQCDILLNHNAFADASRYAGLVPEYCELRCGRRHTLLRDEFSAVTLRERERCDIQAMTVFVAIGATDHSGINVPILEALESFVFHRIIVVTTRANRRLDALRTYADSRTSVDLHVDSDQIAALMNASDLAIVSPSVIVNEVLSLDLPFIAIKTAQNQSAMAADLRRHAYDLLDTFDRHALHRSVMLRMTRLCHTLKNFVALNEEEMRMVLQWRNDERVRRWSLTHSSIPWEQHAAFILSLTGQETKEYFLVQTPERPVGVISLTRIDRERGTASLGLYADPGLRGQGDILMRLIIDRAFRFLRLKTIFAEVFVENAIALKLYKRFGFRVVRTFSADTDELYEMELTHDHW